MSRVSCIRLNAPRIEDMTERHQIMDKFERFLHKFAYTKFHMRMGSFLAQVLAAAAFQIKSQYGASFLGLMLGESSALNLTGKISDVDYYVLLGDAPKDTPSNIVQIVNSYLLNHGYTPCPSSNLHVICLPVRWEKGDSVYPATIGLLPFVNIIIEGEAATIEQNALRTYRDFIDHYKNNRQAYKITPEEIHEDIIKTYRRLLGLEPSYVVKRFLNHCGLFLPREVLERLRKDPVFIKDLTNLAESFLKERERQFPFPRQIEEILALIFETHSL